MFGSYLLMVVLIVVALWILKWHWSRRHLEKIASQLPGPRRLPLIGNALDLGMNTTAFYNNFHSLCSKHGQIFRIWLGPVLYIVLQDPRDLQMLLSHPKNIDKGNMYNFLHCILGKGLVTSSGAKWSSHRKFLTPTFHFQILEHFLEIMEQKSSILIQLLKEENNGQSFDVYGYLSLYTLDVVIETAMGLGVNAQTDSKSSYVNAVKDCAGILQKRMICPWLYPDIIFNLSSEGKKLKEAKKIIYETVHNIIQNKKKDIKLKNEANGSAGRTENGRKRMAFLDLLVQENSTCGSFTEQDIQDEVNTFLAAGHETTASTLSFTIWLLSTHQDIQEKIYKEVTLLNRKENDKNVTISMLNNMKYLNAVIKESLRIYSPIPVIGRQLTEDYVTANGNLLPANSTIVIPITAVHKNSEIYTEPDAFIPERFLNNEKNTGKIFTFIPFSAGPRNCIGQKFAMLSLKASICKIVSHYKLLPDVEFKPNLCSEITLKSTNGIKIRISSRGDEHN